MRRFIWFLVLAMTLAHAANAQKSLEIRRIVQWQVVPELRVVEVGQPVVFILEARNVSGAPLDLRFSSGQQYDVLVYKEGEWRERWRWSRDKMFTMAFTSIRLNFGEVKRFRVEWEQKDDDKRQVPPGRYRAEAILLLVNPQGRREELKASATFTIRAPRRGDMPRLRDLIEWPDRWVGQRVLLMGRNEGWRPDSSCPNCAGGPPVTRSDWVLRDATGCIYVTGAYAPTHTRGKGVMVEGVVRRNSKRQVYIEGSRVLPSNTR